MSEDMDQPFVFHSRNVNGVNAVVDVIVVTLQGKIDANFKTQSRLQFIAQKSNF